MESVCRNGGGRYLHRGQCACRRSHLRHNGLQAFSHGGDVCIVSVIRRLELSLRCVGDAEQKMRSAETGALTSCGAAAAMFGPRLSESPGHASAVWLLAVSNLASFCRLNITSPSRTSDEASIAWFFYSLDASSRQRGLALGTIFG